MIATNNIWFFILAIMPAMLYVAILYLIIPKNFISIKKARTYLVAGLLSPSLITLFYFIFPNWGDPQSNHVFIAYFILAFIQIGVLEEATKYITFQWVSSERSSESEKNDLPIATMFYSVMSAVGFAIAENILYLIKARDAIIMKLNILDIFSFNYIKSEKYVSEALTTMALARGATAVIAHIICGIIMGYFLYQSKRFKYKTENLTEYQHPFNFTKWGLIIQAIFFAAMFHGMYDLNIMLNMSTSYTYYFSIITIFAGLLVSRNIINQLIVESKSIKNKTDLITPEQDATV